MQFKGHLCGQAYLTFDYHSSEVRYAGKKAEKEMAGDEAIHRRTKTWLVVKWLTANRKVAGLSPTIPY